MYLKTDRQTRSIARPLYDSRASCYFWEATASGILIPIFMRQGSPRSVWEAADTAVERKVTKVWVIPRIIEITQTFVTLARPISPDVTQLCSIFNVYAPHFRCERYIVCRDVVDWLAVDRWQLVTFVNCGWSLYLGLLLNTRGLIGNPTAEIRWYFSTT